MDGERKSGIPAARKALIQLEVLAPCVHEPFQAPTPRSGLKEGELTRGDSGSHQTDDPATWSRELMSHAKVSLLDLLLVAGRTVLATSHYR